MEVRRGQLRFIPLEKGEMSQMDELIERIKANDERIKKNLINKGIKQGRTAGRDHRRCGSQV